MSTAKTTLLRQTYFGTPRRTVALINDDFLPHTERKGLQDVMRLDDAPAPRRVDSTLVRALARAFRWRRMLDAGEFITITELAVHEKVTLSYVTRVLRLTLLAPRIVEAILDGRQGPEVTLANLMEPFPPDWKVQTCQAIGLKQMGQAAACPNGVVLTLSRERPHRFFC